MIGEEIAINDYLSANGIEPIETDLGEYIIQIRNEIPSHIIAPAIHLTQQQVEASFRETHTHLDPARQLAEPRQLLDEARGILRQKFLDADVGITGANFLVAETGTSVIVTNEGNGDLTQLLPKAHIVLASLEKVVPTLEDTSTILRVLARSATGQDMSVYTTFSTGPRRAADLDGPGEYHVILLDNGRSALLGSEFQEILRCIRCGACMNNCPVYASVGGHAYGWVYPGPMGAVLTPSLIGIENARHLPNASTFCGRCESVCPMRIPLPKMMRHYREQEYERKLSPRAVRTGLAAWAFLARRPALYHRLARIGAAAARPARPAARAASTTCRSPAAGPRRANCRRRRARRSRRCGGSAARGRGPENVGARADPRRHPALAGARRARRRSGGAARAAHRPAAARPHPGAHVRRLDQQGAGRAVRALRDRGRRQR